MKRFCCMLLIPAMLLAMAGCASSAEETAPETGADNPASSVRLLTEGMEAEKGRLQDVEPGNYTAVGDLGQALLGRVKGDNPLVSPLSAYIALSMAAEGAKGKTAEEFTSLLGGDAASRGKALRDLASALEFLGEGKGDLALANSFWIDENAVIREEYLRRLAQDYRAEGYAGPLSSESVTDAMNAWVKEKTQGRISGIFSEPPDPDTVLILINTLYFKGAWLSPFSEYGTKEGDFITGTGESVRVPFMNQSAGEFEYCKSADFEGVILPFTGSPGKNAKMIFLKPQGMTARALAEKLDGKSLSQVSGKVSRIDLSLPSFTAETGVDLRKILPELGLTSAFDPETADFGGMGPGRLFIGSAFQKVRIAVDEKGAEGAAASYVDMESESIPEPDFSLAFDRPFVYAVVDSFSGVPFFMGIVDDPSLKG